MTDTQSSEEEVIRERNGCVEWILFNRPAVLNALSTSMEESLLENLYDINQDSSVRAVVITGVSGKRPAFMAGADFDTLNEVSDGGDCLALERNSELLASAIEDMTMTTIAAMSGICVGAGAILASCCDIRIAAPSLKFGLPIARSVGNCLTIKNYARLEDMLGVALCKDMIFSADLLNAQTLDSVGAVRRIVPEAQLHFEAQEIADSVSELAPLTLWATKTALQRLRQARVPDDADQDLLETCYHSDDFQEAVNAFQAKRKPEWSGS